MTRAPIEKSYLILVLVLAFAGFFIFSSASLGLLAQTGPTTRSVVTNQAIGLAIGLLFFYIFSKIDYRLFRRCAFFIFIGAILLNLVLFIPDLSLFHGGASRWIELGSVSFQPSEFLKIAFIIYFAAWLAHKKAKISDFKSGLLPFLVLMAITGALLLSQRDTDTFAIIFATGLGQLIIAGGKLRHIGLGILAIIAVVVLVAYFRPYARERIMTYLNPSSDPQGAGYQLQQSLIAVGSGGAFGRGYGQSIQKFGYLPEPVGDSIYAVAGEEFGFLGATILVVLFILFAIKCLRIAARSPDVFAGLLVSGIAILVVTESFMNMASEIGLIPLSGIPLLFVSHGGTALVLALSASGIVANVSRYAK
jgi:cell division protein FtsW